MKHPLFCLSSSSRIWIAGVSAVVTVIGFTVLRVIDPSRVTRGGANIVQFELAGKVANANAILESWGESGRKVAAFNLGFDYLFIAGYSTLMAFLCSWASQRNSNRAAASVGVVLAWLQWVAGAFDCTENAALLFTLFREASRRTVEIARVSAITKFALLACGASYVLGSLPRFGRVREGV